MRALTSLRHAGAVAEVFGSGKIPRYRHLAYEWFGVEKEELAILAELLLRGEQTEGDLRGRASRMDPIPDLDLLRGYLDRLAAKGLVVWLSPPGRGRMLTHGLLPAEKLEKVRSQLGMTATDVAPPAAEDAPSPPRGSPAAAPLAEPTASDQHADKGDSLADRVARLEAEVAGLRSRLESLERDLGGM